MVHISTEMQGNGVAGEMERLPYGVVEKIKLFGLVFNKDSALQGIDREFWGKRKIDYPY